MPCSKIIKIVSKSKKLKILFLIFLLPIINGCKTSGLEKKELINSKKNIVLELNLPKYGLINNLNDKSCYREVSNDDVLNYRKDSLLDYAKKQITNGNWFKGSTALTVTSNKINSWIRIHPALVNYAIASGKKENIEKSISLLEDYADEKILLNIKYQQNNDCWKSGASGKCSYHLYEYSARAWATIYYMGVALKTYMNDKQKQKLDNYFKDGWDNLVKHIVFKKKGPNGGIYGMADGGIAALLYYQWTNNNEMLRNEIFLRRSQWINLIKRNGYIYNNSFRGVRAFWYHTLGAEVVFSYSLIAKEMGVDFFKDKTLGPRLEKLAEKTLLGVTNLKDFLKPGSSGTNLSKRKQNSRTNKHRYAVNLPIVLKNEFGISHKKLDNPSGGTSVLSLISAECYYSNR